MRRREFITTAAATACALGTSAGAARAAETMDKDLLELRIYHFASVAKLEAFESFLAGAAVPALNRLGVSPVGAFRLLREDNPDLKPETGGTDLHVLLPHRTAESVARLVGRLSADPAFTESGKPILEAPKPDPAYVRFESSLLLCFDGCPRVEVPTKSASRVLQLRIYESHNCERALKKIHMFNEGGEIQIFRRCGMNPVFFGQALVGSKLPNLTYMLGFEDKAAMAKAWGAFGADPAWIRLKDDPAYKDTVSSITNLILRPTASSQI